jgi:hypothetical protein
MDPGSRTRKIYDGAKQAELLTMELNCIGWASALMLCVYDFINNQRNQVGIPTFEIPNMRFVNCGLAISKAANRDAFLLEEFIDSDQTGSYGNWFVKYLNNNSAKPRRLSDHRQAHCADFLSFAQHVQFWKTEGLAFVSDLQGMFQFCVVTRIYSYIIPI